MKCPGQVLRRKDLPRLFMHHQIPMKCWISRLKGKHFFRRNQTDLHRTEKGQQRII